MGRAHSPVADTPVADILTYSIDVITFEEYLLFM